MPQRRPVINTAIAARIAQARQAAGFDTPEAAAIRLGMVASVYQRQELGYHKPKPDDLRRYADLFGVSVGWLNTGIGTASPK